MTTKKLLTLWIFVLLTAFSFGQVGKGNIMVGGLVAADYELQDVENFLSVQIHPQLGIFVTDHIAVGASLGLGFTQHGDVRGRVFGLAPFVRYYLGSTNVRPFIHAQGGIISGATKFKDEKLKETGYQIFMGPGLSIFLNEHLAIEGILGYTLEGGDFDYENFGLGIGIQAYLDAR